jgi:hypothetical protein
MAGQSVRGSGPISPDRVTQKRGGRSTVWEGDPVTEKEGRGVARAAAPAPLAAAGHRSVAPTSTVYPRSAMDSMVTSLSGFAPEFRNPAVMTIVFPVQRLP